MLAFILEKMGMVGAMEEEWVRVVKEHIAQVQQGETEVSGWSRKVKNFFGAVVEDVPQIKNDYLEGAAYRRYQRQVNLWESDESTMKDILSSQRWAIPGGLTGVLLLMGKESAEEMSTDPAFLPNTFVNHVPYVAHLTLGTVGVAAGIGLSVGLVGDNIRSWWIGKQIRRGEL